MTVRLFVVAMVLIAGLARGQQPARDTTGVQPAGTATISGIVLLGATGDEPSRRTRVTLKTTDPAIAGRTATTDDSGRFTFRDVPGGRFTLQATRPGYLTSSYGAHRPGRPGTAIAVANGAQVANLALRLTKGSVLTGTVRDANGQPVQGVTITALRYTYNQLTGEVALGTDVLPTTTDDRGVYRVWGLPAGNFIVMATPSMGSGRGATTEIQQLTTNDVARAIAAARERATGPPPVTPPLPRVNYAPVFSPGTPDVAQATPIALKESEERVGVDISVRLFRTARITASVRTGDGSPMPATVQVTLTPAGAQGYLLEARSAGRKVANVDAQGKVLFTDVGPGRYTVMINTARPVGRGLVNAPPPTSALWAQADVNVDGADISLDLVLQQAMKSTGRLIFQGTSPPPNDPSGLQVFLVPPGAGGNLSAGPLGGLVAADGTFSFVNITPGLYRAAFVYKMRDASTGWVLQSVTANGRDAWDSWLEVRPGEVLDIAVTYTDHPTDITGTLRDAAGQPLAEHSIIVFPADKARWIPGTKRISVARPGTDGEFSISGLPAGDYLLVALADVEPGEWNDPAFLEALAPSGIKISLAEGEKKRQDLQIK